MNNSAFAVLTAVGPDRVGIVDDVSALVATRGGNIEESKMAVLGGEFAAVALVSLESDALADLKAALPDLQARLGLHLELKPTRGPVAAKSGRPYLLETVSLDTPGIVHSVTAVIKAHDINIEELETSTQPAPWTGAPMFRMRATLILGPQVSVPQLKSDLALLESERDLDISLKPALPGLPE
jgi:glycine cleavage system transcriptional repressor